MTLPPLLALAFLAAAPAPAATRGQPPPRLSSGDQAFLRENGFDPEVVSPAAFQAAQGDPASFIKANRASYDRFTQWREDPGRMLAAERRKPGSAEKALKEMEGFARPEQLAALRSQLKLAPHGVDARLPEAHGFDADREGGGDPAPTSPPPSRRAKADEAGEKGVHFSQPSAPAGRQAAADEPQEGWSLDQVMDWLCRKMGCAPT